MVLLLTIHICIEPPKRRRDERFVSEEPALVTAERQDLSCVVRDISVGGARLECSAGWDRRHGGSPDVSHGWHDCSFSAPAIMAGDLTVRFDEDACSRRLMTAKLFTGGYHNEIERVSAWSVLCTTARSLVS